MECQKCYQPRSFWTQNRKVYIAALSAPELPRSRVWKTDQISLLEIPQWGSAQDRVVPGGYPVCSGPNLYSRLGRVSSTGASGTQIGQVRQYKTTLAL